MEHRCEVCESFNPEGDLKAAHGLLEVSFTERTVLLCRGHAGIARNSEVTSLQQLRALYAESTGQRSYIGRRARLSPQAASAPRSAGRRASDVTG